MDSGASSFKPQLLQKESGVLIGVLGNEAFELIALQRILNQVVPFIDRREYRLARIGRATTIKDFIVGIGPRLGICFDCSLLRFGCGVLRNGKADRYSIFKALFGAPAR